MATQRYISTGFWDDRWIRSLDPSERYLYLYLMTNPLTNIAGIYQITMDRVAFDTGYDERTLQPMLQRFADAGKAIFYHDEWMILPSWPKHQRPKERDNVRKGIDNILMGLPDDVYEMVHQGRYQYKYLHDIEKLRPFKPLARPSNYSDTDTDTDTDSSLAQAPKTIAPLKDDLAARWEAAFVAKVPMSAWGDIGRGRRDCGVLAKKLRALSKDTGIDETALASSLIASFLTLKSRGKADFWRTATFTPTGFLARWAEVVDETAKENSKPEMDESTKVFLEGVYAKRD